MLSNYIQYFLVASFIIFLWIHICQEFIYDFLHFKSGAFAIFMSSIYNVECTSSGCVVTWSVMSCDYRWSITAIWTWNWWNFILIWQGILQGQPPVLFTVAIYVKLGSLDSRVSIRSKYDTIFLSLSIFFLLSFTPM